MAVYQDRDKNGNIIKTKDGRSWYFRVYYDDKFGNRKQHKSKKFMKKNEAQDAERNFLYKIKNSDEIDKNVSFQQVYYEWLSYKKTQLKLTTFYNLEKNTKKQILNFFDKYKLLKIKAPEINDYIAFINNLK